MTVRYVEDTSVAFVIWCDENGLTLDEGRDLAEKIGDELDSAADSRSAYLEEGGE